MSVKEELETIRKANGGVLRPQNVVEFASNPNTELHSRFCWDDTKAAHEYRLWQAREVIRVTVTMLPNKTEPTRVYVSLLEDRAKDGYRALVDVMGDKTMRESLLDQARAEADTYRRRYQQLVELTPVFEAMGKVFPKGVAVRGRRRESGTASVAAL